MHHPQLAAVLVLALPWLSPSAAAPMPQPGGALSITLDSVHGGNRNSNNMVHYRQPPRLPAASRQLPPPGIPKPSPAAPKLPSLEQDIHAKEAAIKQLKAEIKEIYDSAVRYPTEFYHSMKRGPIPADYDQRLQAGVNRIMKSASDKEKELKKQKKEFNKMKLQAKETKEQT